MPNYDPYGYGAPSSKPQNNCRTCTDFKYFAKQQRQIYHKSDEDKDSSDTRTGKSCDDGCPVDKAELGRSTWNLLHTIAAFYSEHPTDSEKRDIKSFYDTLTRIYPCSHCAKDFRADLKSHPINVDNQHELTQWLCKFHNRVNKKLGKPEFDCTKINERWRDGWKDGSCGSPGTPP